MPFCPDCKSLVYPSGGQMVCKKCGWSKEGTEKRVVRAEAEAKERVVLEEKIEARAEQEITCPKCGHNKAYFHLMQTRRSDEPPTEINECTKCGYGWREY